MNQCNLCPPDDRSLNQVELVKLISRNIGMNNISDFINIIIVFFKKKTGSFKVKDINSLCLDGELIAYMENNNINVHPCNLPRHSVATNESCHLLLMPTITISEVCFSLIKCGKSI